jgi:protein-L-isoaspartate(D-aspartate) O-methyltransferase
MALMLELLDLQPGMRVLEIGTGTGYNAALMAELVGDPGLVSTIDIQEDVVEQTRRRLALAGYRQIRVIARDGFVGCLDFAPYDRIVATVGCSALSPRWLDQLAPEGVVLIPLAHGDAYNCPLIRIWRENQRIFGRIVGYSTFMAIRGALRRDLWLSEAENHDQYTSIQMREPDAVYPLFEGLMELSKTTPGLIDDQAARLEFFYFLALHIPHTFVLWKGIGLGDHMGSVLLTKDSIELYGSQAKRRYQELERIYRLWDDRGRPRMYEYEIEFLASSEVSEASPVSQQSKWVIERPYFRQLVRL